jgi:hypothetical protein
MKGTIMQKLLIYLALTGLLLSGCSFDVQVMEPVPASPVPLTVTDDTASPSMEPISTPLNSSEDISSTRFYNVYFALNSNDGAGISSFPAGTNRIFAVWNYKNMKDGMVVKRDWYLDGKLWLTREEPWDFAKYGENGTIRDVSIYDLDIGLPSGLYQLRLSVDNIPQQIGPGQMQASMVFEIQPLDGISSASASPDDMWGAYVYGMKRIVLRDAGGTPRELFTGREISYVTWFADSAHFLFVDRDYSGQQPGSPIGVRDDLWIANVATGQVALLYRSEAEFQGFGGPQPSLDGKYISGLIGSGFGDACFVDTRLIFLEVASDFKSVKAIEQKDFIGIPSAADSVVVPAQEGEWRAGNQYAVTLKGTCSIDPSLMGAYVFDVPIVKATNLSPGATLMGVGDLGWGEVHGLVTDAVTGKVIIGATVTCEHSSYTSPSRCSGSMETGIPGVYIFQKVFFHDTDTIKLTVSAPGYKSQEFTQNSFTINDLKVNFILVPLP